MFSITFLIGIVLMGFAAQFIDGTLGMGYGVSSTSLLVGGVIAAPIAAWVCKKLPHRMMGILIGVLLILLNVRTLVLTFVR